MRQLTADFDARFRCGDTPWEEPHPWHGLEALFARYVPAAARVLDVGCGLGTNALRLAALGYHVLAIDVSATAIAAAKARALAADSSCEFRCADLLSGGLGPAEVAFERGCLHSFADAEGRASFARALAESLVPGGLRAESARRPARGSSRLLAPLSLHPERRAFLFPAWLVCSRAHPLQRHCRHPYVP